MALLVAATGAAVLLAGPPAARSHIDDMTREIEA